MGSIGRYLFRTTLGAFLLILVSLTLIIWITQALRDFDLMTSQGQTIFVFLGITSLVFPILIVLIAPIALMIGVAHVLNRLGADSEIIVMNAAGMSPWRLFGAFLGVAIVVSVMQAAISAYFAPKALRTLRQWATEIRADLVTHIVQPGRFVRIEQGLTFHIRERRPNGQLLGILLDDQRDPKERATYLAEQGEILKNERGTYLVLEQGSLQRQELSQADPKILTFDRYAFDLSQFAERPTTAKNSVRERYFWELLSNDPDEQPTAVTAGRIRAELHDRVAATLYPIAFVVIAFAYLGAPRTTRESRALSLLGVVIAVVLLRLVGFAAIVFSLHVPAAVALQYLGLACAFGLGIYVIGRGVIIEPPVLLANALNQWNTRFARQGTPV